MSNLARELPTRQTLRRTVEIEQSADYLISVLLKLEH